MTDDHLLQANLLASMADSLHHIEAAFNRQPRIASVVNQTFLSGRWRRVDGDHVQPPLSAYGYDTAGHLSAAERR